MSSNEKHLCHGRFLINIFMLPPSPVTKLDSERVRSTPLQAIMSGACLCCTHNIFKRALFLFLFLTIYLLPLLEITFQHIIIIALPRTRLRLLNTYKMHLSYLASLGLMPLLAFAHVGDMYVFSELF